MRDVMHSMDIDEICTKSIAGEVNLDDFVRCASVMGVDTPGVFNAVLLQIASRFNDNVMSFEDADCAMNNIWPIMLDYVMKHDSVLIEPCYSIFLAFDEGEYIHGPHGTDPVERFTKPAIADILKNA